MLDWVQELGGLRPRAVACVGPGYSREDLKAEALGRGLALTARSITSLDDLALECAGLSRDRFLGPAARQEVLRLLLSVRGASARMPELSRLKRQGSFYRRLDLAIQSGRLAFAHDEEAETLYARLDEAAGVSPLRQEVAQLARAYEGWMQASELCDLPMALAQAVARLDIEGLPASFAGIETVHVLAVPQPEAREQSFWEALGRRIQVERHRPQIAEQSQRPTLGWEMWHSQDDAAEALAARLAATPETWDEEVILLRDSGETRRCVIRALKAWGVQLADPRDPTRLRWDEGLKWAMLPLEVVGRGFERDRVASYLRSWIAHPEHATWIEEIAARGIANGLRAYEGGRLIEAHSRLRELNERLGGRRTCAEVGEAHLALLREHTAATSDGATATLEGELAPSLEGELAWTVSFFEALWSEFARDVERVEREARRAPLHYWLERLQARIIEAPAPVERLKASRGVRLYRLQQAPIGAARRAWVLGMPANWLTGEGVGDYWLGERDRERLTGEFAVRSSISVREERLAVLSSWFSRVEEVQVLDSQYESSGRERESAEGALRELAAMGEPLGLQFEIPEAPESRGTHPRWVPSYGSLRPTAPLAADLGPETIAEAGAIVEISASTVESYSRCGFKALAERRWKLSDAREPDAELWPDMRGNLLHEAVRVLVESRDAQGRFSLSPGEALDRAWKTKPPRGLLRGKGIERYVRSRLLTALDSFCVKEREFFDRAGTRPIALDREKFRFDVGGVTVVGTPDRVDEHPDGIFVIDYKSGSGHPSGTDMLELGYRLQLPFYALAAAHKTGKRVLGVQFVELNKKASRSSGVFFKSHNGKTAGMLTNAVARSKSLFDREPEEVWGEFKQKLAAAAQGYASGRFEARPRSRTREKECRDCVVADLCGYRRLSGEDEESEAAE